MQRMHRVRNKRKHAWIALEEDVMEKQAVSINDETIYIPSYYVRMEPILSADPGRRPVQ